MKEVYLLRHAEKGPDGELTENGIKRARELAMLLPHFAIVISSESSRTQKTAEYLTGVKPKVDPRAGFYMASPEKSDAINRLATEQGKTFLEALEQYQDPEVHKGVSAQATRLNELIKELLVSLGEDEKAVIVSHDLSISPAMAQNGIPLESSIEALGGYVIGEDGTAKSFSN